MSEISIQGSQTEKNILTAFAGESQARNRYTYFASAAKKEGFMHISTIFAETADQERSHAKQLFKMLQGGQAQVTASFPAGAIGSTLENLKAAAEGENYETSEMYPQFAAVAEKEGFREIAAKLRTIAVAEAWHRDRYLALAKNIEENAVYSKDKPVVWVCSKCGYIHESASALKKCPLCNHPQAYFQIDPQNY